MTDAPGSTTPPTPSPLPEDTPRHGLPGHRLQPGQPVDLTAFPTRGDAYHDDKDAAQEELGELKDELAELQERLYAEGERSLLVVLQALDAGGKNSTTRRVFTGVNPEGVRVTSFKVPSAEERAHDFLWRIHKAVPAAGMIGVFNRSHYEDVLVVRVDELAPEPVWRARYDQINRFEQHLVETGTTLVKLYLHLSKEEQKERFEDRLRDPEKHWKFSKDDLRKRAQWDDYRTAYEEALERCTTPWAPWHIIPADQKWYRDLAVARILVGTLRMMGPEFPQGEGLEGVLVE